MIRHSLLIFPVTLLFWLISLLSYGQEKCGTVEYEKIRHAQQPKLESDDAFELWMKQKIGDLKLRAFQTGQIQSGPYTIPVVVHVIHNGEPVGTGTNISDTQILSQIQVLNDDYNRTNADKSNTPAEFLPMAGSLSIQFVLAKQDPEGLATNGITRTQGTKTSWTLADNSVFKSLSYWPAENYLNIWVINLVDNGLIGYAQFPVSSTLPDLKNSINDRLTDGVIINYKDFGSGVFNLDAQYNKGRTTTHEVGHYFGLRHIWGDGNCATDYVDDTPFQSGATTNCPTGSLNSCDPVKPHKMYQNYLDYTWDACMNLFTMGQVDRMAVVLQNSPRRASLTSSPGGTPPPALVNDVGIRQTLPSGTVCGNPVIPQVEIRNYGSNVVTSTQIQLSINGNPVETKIFSSLNLSQFQTTNLSFSPLTFTPSSSQQIHFQITQTDENSGNNSLSAQVQVPVSVTLPVNEPFNSLPSNWLVSNPDSQITWSNVVAADSNPSNRAMYVNFNGYENRGAQDWLLTPSFAIVNPATSQLKFDVAYAQYPGENGDGLKVYALPACNQDLTQGVLLYDKSGAALATAPSTTNSFVPSSGSQWRKSEVIPLSSLNSSGQWQLTFISNNGYGNNLFIDNVVVSDQVINDVALTGIVSPSLVHCSPNPVIQFGVKNFSTFLMTSFQVQSSLNGGSVVTQNFSSLSLSTGDQQTYSLAPLVLQQGKNQITMTIVNPNGLPDATPTNNTLIFNNYLDQSADAGPLRKTFDNSTESSWVLASQVNEDLWQATGTNYKQSVVYKAFTNTSIGEESWLVSPVLDLSRYSTNSLLFDVSYAQNIPAQDRLKILGSDDCGVTYKYILYDHAGSDFSVTNSASEWTPTSTADWNRQYVGLDSISSKKNIRLAVVATNGHGNNLYIDNLEIFAGDDPQPPVTSVPYQLYYSSRNSQSDLALTFNLSDKKDVRLQIFSIMGQVVADNLLPGTLNQTYYFDLSVQSTGIYLFRILIDDQVSTTKVFVGH